MSTLFPDVAPPAASVPVEALPTVLSREDVQRAEQMSRDVAALQGRRTALASRDTELVDRVGLAKGRIADKAAVDAVLEALQKRAHERSVGAFETMLSAATDDVLSSESVRGQRAIKLDLTIERNMPALDIYAMNRGSREDITSGAVANVVSTGLRFIALARAGGARPLMVLDEADCWIEHSGAVRNYYNMVNQLSQDAGIQTVVITHHDVSEFADDFRIYKVSNVDSQDPWPARSMELVTPGRTAPGPLEEDRLTWLALENFESYPRARIDLAPGVTVISGPNEHGKSGWARALRAAFMADAGDGVIRHAKPNAVVSVGFSDGRVLQYRRQRKGNPKAEFILHSDESWARLQAGEALQELRPLHHTPGARLPEWLPAETGVKLIDDINVQLHGQLVPVFMLGDSQTPSKRASLLSIGRESGYLFAMNEVFKDDLRADAVTVRDGEKELTAIRATLERMAGLPELAEDLTRLRAMSATIVAETQALAEIDQVLTALQQQRAELARLAAEASILAELPAAPALEPTERLDAWFVQFGAAKLAAATPVTPLPPSEPKLEPTADHDAWLHSMTEARAAKAHARFLVDLPELPTLHATADHDDALRGLAAAHAQARTPLAPSPPAVPDLQPTAEVDAMLQDLQAVRRANEAHRQQGAELATQRLAVERAVSLAAETLGNECPVCHSYVDVAVLLGDKPHDHAPRP